MNKLLNLKQVLTNKNIQKGIKTNLFTSDKEAQTSIEKTFKINKDNVISIETIRDKKIIDFENTLYLDKIKKSYLLESRVFDKIDGHMINSYLQIFDFEGNFIEDYVDDVWKYANWEIV